ncbi:MAG TPA: NAD(P)/FAD-dependent oxidoreductase [Pyrinomonadaceae bacterium]|nr:NAD(P)/FAD-dependent oxidoreductase [Pyrinomonadaceae bacterium]
MFTADVVIVGGGPAGAAIALALAKRGLAPIVLEAHSAPQLKVGECLPPTINPLLDHFGLTERLRRRGNLPSYGNRFVWGSNSIEERDFIFSSTGAGWRLDRADFEEELKQAATEAGALWHCGRRVVACSGDKNSSFKLTVRELDGVETYRSDFVVDATGRSARLAGSLGARRVIYDRLIAVAGFFDEDAAAPAEEDSFTLVEAVSSGWWYSSRLPGGKLIAVYMTDGDLLDHALRQTDRWLALLNKTKYTAQRVGKYSFGNPSPPRILPAHTVRLTAVTGDGWLAAGDSAVAFDPLASHGISMAMGSGYHAALSIIEYLNGRTDALRVYERLIDRSFAHYLLMHHDAYLREQRWPHELFWRRRHAPASEAPLPKKSLLDEVSTTH